jgi:hypothetical protein
VRWAAVEAVQRIPTSTRLGRYRDRIGERRGRNIGVVAAARELLTLVFYGLRDHGSVSRCCAKVGFPEAWIAPPGPCCGSSPALVGAGRSLRSGIAMSPLPRRFG